MGRLRDEPPAIYGRIADLQKEADALGDDFLRSLFGIVLLHLEEQVDTLGLLHQEPIVQSPLAQTWLKQLWPPRPGRVERPREVMMPPDAKCRTCRLWTGKEAPAGECRRFPPIKSSILHGEVMSAAQPVWPVTNADDWCGEWQVAASTWRE